MGLSGNDFAVLEGQRRRSFTVRPEKKSPSAPQNTDGPDGFSSPALQSVHRLEARAITGIHVGDMSCAPLRTLIMIQKGADGVVNAQPTPRPGCHSVIGIGFVRAEVQSDGQAKFRQNCGNSWDSVDRPLKKSAKMTTIYNRWEALQTSGLC